MLVVVSVVIFSLSFIPYHGGSITTTYQNKYHHIISKQQQQQVLRFTSSPPHSPSPLVLLPPAGLCGDGGDINGDTESHILSALSTTPRQRRTIVPFDMSLVDAHDSVFDLVVPDMVDEHGAKAFDWVSAEFMKGNEWEKQQTVFIAERLKECKQQHNGGEGHLDMCTFVDIGANIGWFAAAIGSMGYNVVAFEANPLLLTSIYSTIHLPTNRNANGRGVGDVRLIPYGLGDTVGKCGLFSSQRNVYGGAAIDCNNSNDNKLSNDNSFIKRGDVLVAPGDCFLYNIKSIHVIKIDVEGFEVKALQGLTQTIKRTTPQFILAEFSIVNLRRIGFTGVQLLDCFEELGYECFHLGNDGNWGSRPILRTIVVAADNERSPQDKDVVCRSTAAAR
eukprot:GHVS01096073.1.p1 GENE.GHVS01096073.1~~GHVS01096073.1.p1  ORF type:complete len:442 (-),score=93.26 GHVS01096073.1:182-1354(-)